MDRPLSGARVVEIGGSLAVAAATKPLSDYGADVIKIEPAGGSPMRRLPPFPDDLPSIETGAYHVTMDTGKRSMVLDVTTPSGREVISRLAATTDVFVLHVSPEETERIRAAISRGAEAAGVLEPCTVALAEQGLDGPYAGRVENDLSLFAWSSRMRQHAITGEQPMRYAPNMIIMQWASSATAAVVGALWGREHQQETRHFEVAGVEALLGNVDTWILVWQARGDEFGREAGRASLAYPAGCYLCQDGYISISSTGDVFFRRACVAIGHPELVDDPRFMNPVARAEHKEEFHEYFLPWVEARTRDEVFTQLQAHGVMVAPVLTMDEVPLDRQAVARGSFVEAPMPDGGTTTIAGPPFHMVDGWTAEVAPHLSAHTTEVLDALGYTRDEQIALFRAGVTG